MFKRLTDFSYARSGKEAFGFYLAYLLFIIVVNAIIMSLFNGMNLFYPDSSMRMGTAVAITCCLALSFFIITKKNLINSFGYILLSLISGFVATFGGGLLGLIIPAILTTKNKKKNK